MSQSVRNAIERARSKRERRWDQWWKSRMNDLVKKKEIELDRIQFEEKHEKGIPLESIPLLSPEPPIEIEVNTLL